MSGLVRAGEGGAAVMASWEDVTRVAMGPRIRATREVGRGVFRKDDAVNGYCRELASWKRAMGRQLRRGWRSWRSWFAKVV